MYCTFFTNLSVVSLQINITDTTEQFNLTRGLTYDQQLDLNLMSIALIKKKIMLHISSPSSSKLYRLNNLVN